VQIFVDRQKRIALLEQVVASERALLDHPLYGIAAARVIADARHELAVLRALPLRRLLVH
jgi:hypothetical protein